MNTNILKNALISEKSFTKTAESKFTFIVTKSATKETVAATVKDLFGVDVISVNIANMIGKVKRSKKGLGRRSDLKKATVTLKKGQKIDLFEIEKEEDKATSKEKTQKDKSKDVKIKEPARQASQGVAGGDKDTTVKVRNKLVK